MYKVDLNCDLGESFGAYTIGMDTEIIKYVSSVNVACGWHGGDPIVMDKTVLLASQYKVSVGAHPGYNDLIGFGRRNMTVTPNEAKQYVKYQLGALMAFTKTYKIEIQHLKPHGALYNMAATDINLARAIVEAVYEVDNSIILLGLGNSMMSLAAKEKKLKFANEVFADRAYNDDGTLVSRSISGSVIHDENDIIKRTVKMIKEKKVQTITGKYIDIKADSVCIHGDNPSALNFVKNIRDYFEKENIEVVNLKNII